MYSIVPRSSSSTDIRHSAATAAASFNISISTDPSLHLSLYLFVMYPLPIWHHGPSIHPSLDLNSSLDWMGMSDMANIFLSPGIRYSNYVMNPVCKRNSSSSSVHGCRCCWCCLGHKSDRAACLANGLIGSGQRDSWENNCNSKELRWSIIII